ncbi:Uncharacterized protein APZ42_032490 [Daphnia magna]|uniref:Uncharacterized protein n=1 Tax=Daphnia magna TaxID=35525 RepID=A0A164LLJ1_9CRUS|nr:Uncharacterized protein APZ42_032490 [Daphnia magna]
MSSSPDNQWKVSWPSLSPTISQLIEMMVLLIVSVWPLPSAKCPGPRQMNQEGEER